MQKPLPTLFLGSRPWVLVWPGRRTPRAPSAGGHAPTTPCVHQGRGGRLQAQGADAVFPPSVLRLQLAGADASRPAQKFTRSDPVALAEFSRALNLDAVLLLAVPHHGYTTYPSIVGTPFPALVGKDWYGQCVKELHRRDIAVFGYITLGTNWKYMRENLGKPYIHGKSNPAGVIEPPSAICFNAPGYIELVEAHMRELLTMYPIDALRYDMLFGPKKCLCDGCKAYYKELYGEESRPGRARTGGG